MKKILLFLFLIMIPLALATYTVHVNYQTPTKNGNLNSTLGDFCFNVTGEKDSTLWWNTSVTNEAINIINLSGQQPYGYTQHGEVVGVTWFGGDNATGSNLNCNLGSDPVCGNFTDSGLITVNNSFTSRNFTTVIYYINYTYGKRPFQNFFFDCYLYNNFTGSLNSTNFPITNMTGIIAHRGDIATYYGEGVKNASFVAQYCFNNIEVPAFVGNKTWAILCRAISNTSDYNRINDSSNRSSMWNDYTNPSITINSPVDGYNSSSTTVTINITVIDDNADKCQLWTDFNGTYQTNTSEIRSYTNNTWFNFTPITAPTTISILNETHLLSSNILTVNLIDAGISSVSIGNTSFTAACAASDSVTCNYTSSTGVIIANQTIGDLDISVNYTYADKEKHWKVICNDSVKRTTTVGNYTIYIESTKSAITNVTNATYSYNGFTISWNTNENTNGSIKWGTTAAVTEGNATSSTSFTTSHSATMANLIADTFYYYNITSCDVYGNCNSSGFTINSGFPLYSGWNWYPVLEVRINLQNMSFQSGASTVSFWNETGQEFISFINGNSVNAVVNLTRGNAIALYSSSSIWQNRNKTNAEIYAVTNETHALSSNIFTVTFPDAGIFDVSIGNTSFTALCDPINSSTCNYSKITGIVTANLTIGDLAVSVNYTYTRKWNYTFRNGTNFIGMLNASKSFGELDRMLGNLTASGEGSSNFTAMAYFNNTDSKWISHFWNWSIENATNVPNATVLWVAATQNYSWSRN